MRRIADMLAAGMGTWKQSNELLDSGRTTVLIADEVAEFFASNERGYWEWDKHYPCCAPPWRQIIVEWNEPDEWLIDGEIMNGTRSQHAVYVYALDRQNKDDDDKTASTYKWLLNIQATFNHKPGIGDFWPRTRWLVGMVGMSRFFGRGGGRVEQCNWLRIFPISSDGVALHSFQATLDMGIDSYASHAQIALLAMCFANCKNVQVEDRQPTDEERKWHRRQRSKPIIYKTLRIGGMRKILETEGGLAENGPGKALHICRGHFARYTEDAPLFGKYTGQFWHPQHMRGKKENGEVVKRYNVTAPK